MTRKKALSLKSDSSQSTLFFSNANYRLWKYAVLVSTTDPKTRETTWYVKDGDTRCDTREQALDYAASQTIGKIRGLLKEEMILGVWDMTDAAIRIDERYDPTQSDIHYKLGFDNCIRHRMPLTRRRSINFRGQQSLELHPVPTSYLKNPNWLEDLKYEWDIAHKIIINGDVRPILPEYTGRPYLSEAFTKVKSLNDKFLLGAATGAGKETSTLALIIHNHDVKGYNTAKINVAVATIPSTVSELFNELANVAGIHVDGHGYVDFSRIKAYITKQWHDSYKTTCSQDARYYLANNVTIIESVNNIPARHQSGTVPVLFGSYHDLAQKAKHTRYTGLDKRIGMLSIGEAHQMLSNADNKMWETLNEVFGKNCFKMFVTGTPYDFIYGSGAAEQFDTEERVLFTRNDLYRDKRTNKKSHFSKYPDFNFYGIEVAEIIEHLKQDPRWTDDANGFTWAKFFTYDNQSKKFVYEDAILWLFKRMFGSSAFDKNGDPLSVYNATKLCEVAKQHIMVALPVGKKEASAKVYISALKTLLNKHGVFPGTIFDAYEDNLGDRKKDIEESEGRTLTLTCVKDCTGANIPKLGSFVFMRNLGDSIKFFEQATGRVGRVYSDKTNCGVFIADMDATMNLLIAIEEKISLERGENFDTRTIITNTLDNYNFFTARNGKWVGINVPDFADILEKMNARGNYGINQCLKSSSPHSEFYLIFKNMVANATASVGIISNGNNLAKNKDTSSFTQLGLPFDNNKTNVDESWINMKLSFLSKCRLLAFTHDVKTVQECVELVEASLNDNDKTVYKIVGKGAEWFPVVMTQDHIDITYTNRWIQKFNDRKNDVELLFEMLEDPSHRNEHNFVAAPNRMLRRITNKVLKLMKHRKQFTVFDPCGGRGGFIVYLYKEMIESDIDFIPSNMYYNDVDPAMVAFFKKLNKIMGLNIPDKNITCSDFTKKDYNMMFDVIIGNPPYQDSSNKAKNNKLWYQFVKKSEQMVMTNGYLGFVTPSSIFIPTVGFGKWFSETLLQRFSLVEAVVHEENEYFDVGVGTSHWIIQNTPDKHAVSIPILRDKIIDEVVNKVNLVEPKMKLVHENQTITKEHLGKGSYDVYYSGKNKDKVQNQPINTGALKIVFPFSASYKNQFVTMDATAHFNRVFYVASQQEADNIMSFTLSKLYVFYASNYLKTSGFTPAVKNSQLPMLDSTKKWTDAEVYAHFKLTSEEIAYVEESLKPKSKKEKAT